MTAELARRVERLFLAQKRLKGKNGQVIEVRSIVFIAYRRGRVIARAEDGREIALFGSINDYEKLLKERFFRVHRFYLVDLDRVEGIFERFPEEPQEEEREDERAKEDECELSLRGVEFRIPVTDTYGPGLKEALGIKSFAHLVPENSADRALRLYGLIDFGWRELERLDVNDQAAVADFQKRWDIKLFEKDRMLSYFRQYGVNEIDKRRVIKNILYQVWRWIKKGIEEPVDGNLRSLWYRIKSVLAYHSNVLDSGDVNVYYSVLLEMVEGEGLFRYKDFGFMDMNEPYRGIGAKYPWVVLASEKIGHYLFIRNLAAAAGVSFICLKGEPAVISMEYFSDDLHKVCGRAGLKVFCISDVDPAGYSIEGNLMKRLEQNGHRVEKLVKLVDVDSFATDVIAVLRYPVVVYERKGAAIKPGPYTSMSQVTKARNWFKEVDDERLLLEKDKGGGWKVVTIYGIESDAADRAIIEARFLAELGRLRRKPEKKR
jgi:Holliday junction resolvase